MGSEVFSDPSFKPVTDNSPAGLAVNRNADLRPFSRFVTCLEGAHPDAPAGLPDSLEIPGEGNPGLFGEPVGGHGPAFRRAALYK